MNYLIDEGMSIGKGGNCVVGLLHHFLSTHGLGEKNLRLHADNCSGQNKNRFVDTLYHLKMYQLDPTYLTGS